MPIEIKNCDDDLGKIIEGQGMVTDQELISSLERHLTDDKNYFNNYKYILIDQTELTKLDITNDTVSHRNKGGVN